MSLANAAYEYSFAALSNPSVMIKALKKELNGSRVIVRVVECAGKIQEDVHLKMGNGILSAVEVNGIEEPIGDAVVKDGVKVWSAELSEKRVFSPEAAAVTTDILLDTVKDGTARALSSLPFPVAGKTGTVQKNADFNTDAWSVSYTTEHTLAVWHGGDKMTELGGGHPTRHAANIWRRIYGDKKPGNFLLPRGVERCVIDDYSTFRNRRPTLATPSTPQKYTRTELFLTR